MSYRNDVDLTEISFDEFPHYPSKLRSKIIHDPELLKVMVRKMISKKRYAHSLSVADTARHLAKCHHVDEEKAYIAGLLHDVTKDLSKEEQDNYLRYYDPEKLDYPEKVKHSFTAKYFLRERCHFHDKDILHAIYNHTICTGRDKLSLILYIADKREPLRGVEDDILKIAEKDLYKAFEKLEGDVKKYLKNRGTDERIIENSL